MVDIVPVIAKFNLWVMMQYTVNAPATALNHNNNKLILDIKIFHTMAYSIKSATYLPI